MNVKEEEDYVYEDRHLSFLSKLLSKLQMNVTCPTWHLLDFYENPFLGVQIFPSGVENGGGGMELDRRAEEMEWHLCQVCGANTVKIKCNAVPWELLEHISGYLRTQTK